MSRSVFRPMVVGAAVLASIVAAGSIALAWKSPRVVAVDATEDARRRALEDARQTVREDAVTIAAHVAHLLGHARDAAGRITTALAAFGSEGVPADGRPLQFVPLGTSGLAWSPPDAAGLYVVPADTPVPEDRAVAVASRARRLKPWLTTAIDEDGIVVHAAVWAPADGLVGASSPDHPELLGVRSLVPGFGALAVAGGLPTGPRWLRAGERLAGERVVSYVVPVAGPTDDGESTPLVTVDVSYAKIVRAISRRGRRYASCSAIVGPGSELIAASPAFLDRIGIAGTPLPRASTAAAALRALLGDDSWLSAPAEGVLVERQRSIAAAAAIAVPGWTVLTLGRSPSEVQEAAVAATGVEDAARRQAYGFIALAIALLVGMAVALGALALANSFVRRLRPIVDGAAAHARGELTRIVPGEGEDALGELARHLNSTATRLRRNLGRLEESERQLQGLINTMGEGFVIADADDRITFVNQRLAEMLRRTPAALIGRYVEELLLPESLDRYHVESERRTGGRPSQYEVTWHVYGGGYRRTIVSGQPMFDGDGRMAGSFAVVTDVTERARAQEETARSEKLRALGEMAGGVAHDFNNLLTVILGNTQFLLQEEIPEETKRTLRAIERSALDGTDRVRRITEFNKTRSKPALAEQVDLDGLVVEAVEHARSRHESDAATRGAEYEVVVRTNSRRRIRGNPQELRDALVNVLDNAFESMRKGGKLTVESFDRGEDAVGVRIEDTGVGMDDDVRTKCFDPFFTTKDPGRCAGLGLSIAFGIVRAHGGRIDVRSMARKGSTFTVVLPAWEAVELPPQEEESTARPPKPPEPRVLLVGTDPRELESCQGSLRQLGVYVASVSSAPAALAILADAGIFNTLIVADDLVQTSGWALARDARARREDLRVVLVVSAGRAVDETQARNAGIDRVLVRPFEMRELQSLVLTLLATPNCRREADHTPTSVSMAPAAASPGAPPSA